MTKNEVIKELWNFGRNIRLGNVMQMGRKERCPQCGSKKIATTGDLKQCKVCKHEWAGKPRRRTAKKEKVRF